MAGILLNYRNVANVNSCEFVVDTQEEVALLPTTTTYGTGKFKDQPGFDRYVPLGSTCIVGNDGGDTLVYMLFSFGWKQM